MPCARRFVSFRFVTFRYVLPRGLQSIAPLKSRVVCAAPVASQAAKSCYAKKRKFSNAPPLASRRWPSGGAAFNPWHRLRLIDLRT